MGGDDESVGIVDEECVSLMRGCGKLKGADDKCSVEGLTEMLALGLQLPEETFRSAGRYGYAPPFQLPLNQNSNTILGLTSSRPPPPTS